MYGLLSIVIPIQLFTSSQAQTTFTSPNYKLLKNGRIEAGLEVYDFMNKLPFTKVALSAAAICARNEAALCDIFPYE